MVHERRIEAHAEEEIGFRKEGRRESRVEGELMYAEQVGSEGKWEGK